MHLALNYPSDKRSLPLEYVEFLLCREMGWTFRELEEQPGRRVQQAFMYLEEEAAAHKFREG